MLRYVGPAEIDRARWDALITQAPNGLIYALSWYLDIVSPGWAALVREEQGRYVAALPLPVQTKLGFHVLQQPLFTQQLGLFYLASAAPTAADWQQIGRLLRQRFWFITRYCFNTANAELLDARELGLSGSAATNYCLSLRPAYAQVRAGYKVKRRWEVQRARRRPLLVGPSTDIDQLVRLFADNTAGKIYGIIGEGHEYSCLRALYAAAEQRGMVLMTQARAPTGEVLAMILVWRFKDRLTYLFSGASEAGRQAGAVSWLLDDVFRAHAGQQDLWFDFEAPNVAHITNFYRSFGPAPEPYFTITLDRLPWPLRQLRAARAALARRRRPRPKG